MKKLQILAVGLLLATTGCTDLTEVNTNPTKSSGYIDPALLIPTIQDSHSLGRQNAARFFTFPGQWVNHWTASWGPVEYGGKAKTNFEYSSRLWLDLLYPEAVKNITALEAIADNDPALANFSGIAKVLRVETFLKLSDTYGDVPYFDAGQGYYKKIFNPSYDKQEDIYADFFVRLEEAAAQFDQTLRTPGTSDLYFRGDMEKWKRLANSLKLRVAMRLIKVNPTLAREKASEAFGAGVMTSNADIAAVTHSLDYETLGGGNSYADIMLQASGSAGFGPSQYRMTQDFFRALCVMDPVQYSSAPYRRALAYDPRLLLIGRCYFSQTSFTNGGGLQALADAVDITELVRKYNAGNVNQQGPVNLATAVDGYLNVNGYLTVPSQEFMYGGGIQQTGEYGYTGDPKTRSVWAEAITTTKIQAATWMAQDDRDRFAAVIAGTGNSGMAHAYYRLQPARWISAVDSPWIHMSYAETQFLLAETTVRGWGIDSESAVDRFLKGYLAAVKQFSIFGAEGIPDDAVILNYANTYLVPAIAAGGTSALEEINRQIWILHFMDPFEAWSNVRRTNGMPTAYTTFYNRYPTENQSGGVRPNRLPYPIQEQSQNMAQWQAAVDRIGGSDNWSVRVWWDVQ
ncbi:hypothetical protein FACS1894159_03690 [Bacteroidia bacterium]|nr:hypothetical protein FACS1894159_03690 [Bacteroidia bacterium]